MGLMSAVTGNASEVQPEDVMDTIGPLLAEGEHVTKAYKMIRDFFVLLHQELFWLMSKVQLEKREILDPFHTEILFHGLLSLQDSGLMIVNLN